MKKLLMNNLVAKTVSLALAILLWAVIRKSQLSDPVTSQPREAHSIEFGASAHGEKK